MLDPDYASMSSGAVCLRMQGPDAQIRMTVMTGLKVKFKEQVEIWQGLKQQWEDEDRYEHPPPPL